jgi:hypothetical protein
LDKSIIVPERVSTNYTAYDKLQSNAEQEWQNFRKARENFVGNAVGNIIFGMVVDTFAESAGTAGGVAVTGVETVQKYNEVNKKYNEAEYRLANLLWGVEGIYSVNNAAGDRSNETTVWSGSYDASKAFLANQWGKIGIGAIGIDESTIDKIKDDMEKIKEDREKKIVERFLNGNPTGDFTEGLNLDEIKFAFDTINNSYKDVSGNSSNVGLDFDITADKLFNFEKGGK